MSHNVHMLHLSLAEQGKLHVLKGEAGEALRHFREAIKLCVSAKAPEVFFRHYTFCVLEALEKAGNYSEVEEYCRMADAHYDTLEQSSLIIKKDHGATIERLALMLLLQGKKDDAAAAFARAVAISKPSKLPLSEELQTWLKRGFAVSVERVRQLQHRHGYFTIKADTVNAAIARVLPRPSRGAEPARIFG